MYVSIAILVTLFLVIVLTRFYLIPKLPTNDGKASSIAKLTKYDYAIMLAGTIAYALFSYHHVGSFQQDPVWYGDTSGKEINIILREPMKISKLSLNACFDPSNVTKIYAQTADKKTIDFAVSKTEKGVDPTCSVISLDNKESNTLLERIKLRVTQPNMIVYKFMVYNDKDEPIYNYAYYFDSDKNLDNPEGIFSAPESAMAPFKTQYTHMVFDERYYAMDSYHYLVKSSDINQAHPQLGILLNAIGIKVFGMNPFGWRFIPNLFGVLLLPLVFLFARRLFNRTSVATLAMLFVSVDFMHFTISRMALLESTVTFFIIASYYFLWRYIQLRSIDTRKAFISLFYTGLMVGIAASCKWSGGFILPMLFAVAIFTEYKQSKNLRQYLVILASLVLVPSLIYLACYIPYIWMNKLHFWQSFTVFQSAMFTIHDKLATSAYGLGNSVTQWWTWPLAMNTMLLDFKINIFNANSYSLVLMGNPILWWGSIPTFISLAILTLKERNKIAGFILLTIIMQYLPYMIAKREMYLYYYYSISILVFIGLAYCVYRLCMCYKASRFYVVLVVIYVGLAIGDFVAYYPVYAGSQTDFGYAYRDLSWINSWDLVISPQI